MGLNISNSRSTSGGLYLGLALVGGFIPVNLVGQGTYSPYSIMLVIAISVPRKIFCIAMSSNSPSLGN